MCCICMRIKKINPAEIITTRDFPVYNEHILKIYFKEKDDSQKYFLKKLIEKEMELSKKSIKYIANLL